MKRLLCATDLLPKSESAVDRAGILAHESDADLSLLHVVSPTTSHRILEQSLQIAIARMKSRVRADVLIVGPHEKRGLVDALEGTIAQKVLSARKCALLMVQRPADSGYNNALLALDLSAESGAVVRAAESVLRNSMARATVVHAGDSQDLSAAAIQDLLREESIDTGRYDIAVAAGRPVSILQRAIESRQPDLLVLGTRGNGPLRRTLLGSVANRLLATASCDVLVVPSRLPVCKRSASSISSVNA
jgi:universal stress protein E